MPEHGAIIRSDGKVAFSLWAPSQAEVSLAIEGADTVPMSRAADGWFTTHVACPAGTAYRFRLADGSLVPDPASRRQADDVHGASVVVDQTDYRWRDGGWRGRPWREAIIYEAHAGALGGFARLPERLAELRQLGVTALELMPVNAFPGARNWGYDGVLPYAPAPAYGTPEQLKALVDAAHEAGMMVYLDVVYNHFGPDGNYLGQYAPGFFRADIKTPWGSAIDFRQPAVRSFFSENVLMWLRDYHLDGLRFDAMHAISEQDWIDEMAGMVRATMPSDRHVHLMLEHHNACGPLERDVDAQWNDDLHNIMHVVLTDEHEGYYADYRDGQATKLLRALTEGWVYQGEFSGFLNGPRGSPAAHLPPTAHIFFLQNHDQIGNRAFGERLTVLADPRAYEAAIALQMLCPQIPLLFMGEETASRSPFLFFTDHSPELATAVREGRRAEFAGFAQFAASNARAAIPDPNDPGTFHASIPVADTTLGEARRQLYMRLISLRREHIIPFLEGTHSLGGDALGPKAVLARWRLGNGANLSIACNFDATPVDLPALSGQAIWCPDAFRQGTLSARTTAAFLDRAA